VSWEKLVGVHCFVVVVTGFLALIAGQVISSPNLDLASKTILIFLSLSVTLLALVFEFVRTKGES